MTLSPVGFCRSASVVGGLRLRLAAGIIAVLAAVLPCAPQRAMAGGCVDDDGDGYGSPADASCVNPELDCDDTNPDINPGETEVCNDVDDNCDDQVDEGFFLEPDDSIPVYGYESRGVCANTMTPCDLRFPLPPACTCIPTTHNFGQVVQACVDENGDPTGEPCDNGDPDEDGSLAFGDDCAPDSECQPVPVPLDHPCIEGQGVCARLGTVVCAADEQTAECDATPGAPHVPVEGGSTGDPATDPLCFDRLDNDCDGLTDHEDPECRTTELCDGFDNDNDGQIDEGFGLGEVCVVGVGPCQNSGTLICNAQGGASCTVNPHPAPEAAEKSCDDGIDNDCDGDIDCDDADCLVGPEVCDGVDNDCDVQIDEGFAGLGDSCTAGIGACLASGEIICSMDKMGVRCSAAPLAAAPERLTAGDSCTDGIDNDCDGLTDEAEADCFPSGLTVTCELETVCRNCVGWYKIRYNVLGATGTPEVDATLVALDANGQVMATLPVENGDNAKLGALKNANDPSCMVAETIGGVHQVFAPVPLLRVVVRDDTGKAEAFCSNTPYLEVREPQGSTVSGSSGNEVKVLAAIPGVDPKTLKVLIDCVDIIPQLVPDLENQLPGGPFSGMVNVNGEMIQIVNLVIQAAVGEQSSNTVSMTIVGAGCGGHTLRLEGMRDGDALTEPIPTWCHLDDLLHNGGWNVFDITVISPTAGEVVDEGGLRPASVAVQGEICHGLDIEEILVQGAVANFPPPMVVPLGGEACAGDAKTVTGTFDATIPVADMAQVFAGTQTTRGRFEPGPNMIIAQGTDVQGNTTHDLVPFVVGPAVATPAQITAAMRSVIATHDPDTIHKAFTLVLNNNAVLENGNPALREFFDQFIREFALNLANCMVQPREFCCTKHLSMPWYTPDVDVTFCTTPLLVQVPGEGDPVQRFADTFQVTVTPHDGFLTICLQIPTFKINAKGDGEECTGGCGFFCVARTKVDFDIEITIPDIRVEIDITEDNILHQDNEFTLRLIPGDDDNIDVDGLSDNDIETGCGLLSLGTLLWVASCVVSPITCAAYTLIIGLPTLLTNVFVDLLGFVADHKGIDLCPFVRQIQGDDGMKEQSDDVNVCREDLGPSFDLGLEHTLEAVEITDAGLSLSIAAKISPNQVDPNAPPVTDTLSTDAPLLLPGDPRLRSISMAIADDFWNQLFAGMTQAGKLRANMTRVLKLGQYIPVCEDIKPAPGDPNFDIANRRYARCVGMTECDDPGDFDLQDRCADCQTKFPFRSCGGDISGQTCTVKADCPGICQGICTAGGAGQIGTACNADIGCGIGGVCTKTCSGGPTPGAACTLDTQCKDDCVGCAGNDDATCAQGACNRAARRARDSKINADTDIVLHARTETPPALYLVDDPATEDLVEIIFAIPRARAALIANRDGNNDVGGFSLGDGGCDLDSLCDPQNPCDAGDLDQLVITTLPDCGQESLASNVDCLLWSSCLDLNIKFQIGVKSIAFGEEMRPELEFHLIGLVEPPAGVDDSGEQCGGSFEIPDLDHLNREAAENDARKGLERSFCEKTPPMQSCATSFDGSVQFLNPKLFTIKTCVVDGECDLDFDDYLVITGDLQAVGLGLLLADKVCEKLEQKISEGTGECPDKEEGEPEDRERERICPAD